ncbi:MAG: ATP-binding protein [Saprospiraceae bacterium]|nr:ATP-binding protein [Saprospiraceae bacterium]
MRIVLTGPESSAKTTLCRDLSLHYKGRMIPEYARSYLEQKTNFEEYTMQDVLFIGHKQYSNSHEFKSPEIQFEDTDLVNILVWLKLKFQYKSTELLNLLISFKPQLYLVCIPDIPWTYDPMRESRFHQTKILKEHLQLIIENNIQFQFISGSGRQRINIAKFHIDNFMNKCNFAE